MRKTTGAIAVVPPRAEVHTLIFNLEGFASSLTLHYTQPDKDRKVETLGLGPKQIRRVGEIVLITSTPADPLSFFRNCPPSLVNKRMFGLDCPGSWEGG